MNLFLVKFFNLVNPLIAHATTTNTGTGGVTNPGSSNMNIEIAFTNPLGNGSITSINSLIAAILDVVITLGIPVVVLAVIYSGFLFVTALGDKEKIKTARSTFLWTLVGGMIVLGAWVIAQALQTTINNIING
ncbi:hypothetical protein GW765_00725 [Candidatus Parcubacteria bacterium]|nr:hypothetical protein [Candidatus Parcubacteria bacterium]